MRNRTGLRAAILSMACLGIVASGPGCGGTSSNEREFLETAKPGTPPPFPEVTDYAGRRAKFREEAAKAKPQKARSKAQGSGR